MKFTKMPSKFENNHLGGRVVFPDCRGVSLKMQKAQMRGRAFLFTTRHPYTTTTDLQKSLRRCFDSTNRSPIIKPNCST